MFWADTIANDARRHLATTIARGESIVIRDEKTASGRIHVGSMRGVAIHGIIDEIFKDHDIVRKFLYEINDFDPMDALPAYLDKNVYEEHMGKPLYAIPAPDGKAKNYAEFYAKEFTQVIEETGFYPEFYRASDLYRSGSMNESIRRALEQAGTIRKIYKNISGSIKDEGWLPLSVVCERCGKISTTKTISFDGEKVEYVCEKNLVAWTEGCDYKGAISPFDGNAKLPWKVEWAAKFKVLQVKIEGAGKDHSTKGGARDIANHIAQEIFAYEPPFDIPYEFFLVGGKKMSASKGVGSSAREIADLVPAHIFRLALLSKNPKQTLNFEPEGDTIPTLFDTYDRLAGNYVDGVKDDFTRLFELIHLEEKRDNIPERFLPRFSQIAFLVQMPHMNIEEEVRRMKGSELTEADQKELEDRAYYASNWLTLYAPSEFKFELQMDSVPKQAKDFSDEQKKALKEVLTYIQAIDTLDGQELHTKLHEIKKETNINPKEFFSALYLAFLGKEDGPKAGWFLSVLDKDFLEQRLEETTQ